MNILGVNGGIMMPFENMTMFDVGENHDGSATLLIDGKIVGAVEEERLNRIKHSNKFPVNAIKFLLAENNLKLNDLDYVAIYTTREYLMDLIKEMFWHDQTMKELYSPEQLVNDLFDRALGETIDENKIRFVDHHMAHAASAYYLSGFNESLVVSLDGVGGGISGQIIYAREGELKKIDVLSEDESLGHFYSRFVKYLGYGNFSEYKVMGLAPYGDPSVYREIFSEFFELLPEGKFKLSANIDKMPHRLFALGQPRRKGTSFDQQYKNVAATLQETLEKVILHVLSYHKQKSGLNNLCLAGGVALNCSANGKVMNSNLFKEIFVQPAAHDAGTSMGAAILTYVQEKHKAIEKLEHVYLGPSIETGEELESILSDWNDFVNFEYVPNIAHRAAQLLAKGKIIGWVQGKSEFGPRALGNRSILADPRPKENKKIINEMVKKREGYRPFAPSVIEERATDFFDLGVNHSDFSYMTFVVNVNENYVEKLGAVTHVDGTARIQTVKKSTNEKYWNVINEFGKLTGVPILLNTSFNNNVEPIVNSADDALACFVTTGLDLLIIDDYLIAKNMITPDTYRNSIPELPIHTSVSSYHSFDSFNLKSTKYGIGFNFENNLYDISEITFRLLQNFDGVKTLEDILSQHGEFVDGTGLNDFINELEQLWNGRYIQLRPQTKERKTNQSKQNVTVLAGS